MLIISENIAERVNINEGWCKTIEKLIGQHFDTTNEFENSLCIGQKILFDIENPILPTGMEIPSNSSIVIDQLNIMMFEVLAISIKGDIKTIRVGMRAFQASDH